MSFSTLLLVAAVQGSFGAYIGGTQLLENLSPYVKSPVVTGVDSTIWNNNRGTRFEKINDPFRTVTNEVDKVKEHEKLAAKVEKLLTVEGNEKVEEAKEKVKEMVEKNFVRMLAAILVAGPTRTHQRSEDVFTLMKSVLNNELDFTPVVEKLPFILREKETDQFIVVLKTLRETNLEDEKFRQFGSTMHLKGVMDALGSFDLKQVAGFLSELPQLFEGVQNIVDGVDEYF